jgi:hypothetical protein
VTEWRNAVLRPLAQSHAPLIVLIWGAALLLGGIGYHDVYYVVVPGPDILFAGVVTFPFALPLGFAQIFGLRPGPSAVMPLMTAYWLSVGYAHYRAMSQSQPYWLCAVTAGLLLGGWGWLVNARALLVL